ncbi:MAG: DUF421 domain-containing protein [Deinococcus sp.]|nr:DUF421 domain-containing protein [Deinococcus sp.]
MPLLDTAWTELLNILTPEEGWSVKLVVRTVLSTTLLLGYVVLLARTFGSRTFASFTSFDFLTNVAAGSLVASAILGESIVESSLSILTLVGLQWLISHLSARFAAVQDTFDNPPVVLVEKGRRLEEQMRRARISDDILFQHMRAAGVLDMADVQWAVLESGGSVSIVKKDAAA